MTDDDKQAFYDLLIQVAKLYGKDQRDIRQIASLYWESLRRFDFAEVSGAFSLHVQDTRSGQYFPKPADIIRALEGTAETASMRAWSTVERAIRQVGPYRDVVFDDAVIHAVVADMGGWINLCGISDDELPFKAREFEKRYQGYASARRRFDYPSRLTGIANAHNEAEGRDVEPPVLIGDPDSAQAVLQAGAKTTALRVTMVSNLLPSRDEVTREEAAQFLAHLASKAGT